MTTPADIDAIRERANAFQATMAEWQQTPLGTQKDFELIEAMEEMRDLAITDRETLLDANAQLAERVRTLEAALRPFAEVWAFYGSRIDSFESIAHALFIRGWDDGFMLDADFKQAADALAANADAGNGGA